MKHRNKKSKSHTVTLRVTETSGTIKPGQRIMGGGLDGYVIQKVSPSKAPRGNK